MGGDDQTGWAPSDGGAWGDPFDTPTLSAWLEHRHDNDVAAAIEDAASNDPRLFARLVLCADELGIEPEEFADEVGQWWANLGDSLVPHVVWRGLFEGAGYRIDNEPADRPTEALTLYRGGLPRFRANWSWSPERATARQFARAGVGHGEVGVIWRAVVEPERLLARLTESHVLGFTEYVVDTDGLRIEPDGLSCGCEIDLTALRGADRDAQVALDLHVLVTCTAPTDRDDDA